MFIQKKRTLTPELANSLRGKTVIVRCDFNVPLDRDGNITDNSRILRTLPTIDLLVRSGAKVILLSHLGRPKGKIDPKLSLKPVAKLFQGYYCSNRFRFVDQFSYHENLHGVITSLVPGQILLLENVRFDARDESNDVSYAKELSDLGDFFIMDAFGAAHRNHASTTGIAKFLPSASGLLFDKEVNSIFTHVIENPKHPTAIVLGGAKISDKIEILEGLIDIADYILIGGAMAFTFIAGGGGDIGDSLFEPDSIESVKNIMRKISTSHTKLVLPVDVIAKKVQSDDQKPSYAPIIVAPITDIPSGYAGMDIGPQTIDLFNAHLRHANTIVWNGPMGVFETFDFATGTRSIAHTIASFKDKTTIVGGGDTITAINDYQLSNFTHISTGGGAFLDFMKQLDKLPGYAHLSDAE